MASECYFAQVFWRNFSLRTETIWFPLIFSSQKLFRVLFALNQAPSLELQSKPGFCLGTWRVISEFQIWAKITIWITKSHVFQDSYELELCMSETWAMTLGFKPKNEDWNRLESRLSSVCELHCFYFMPHPRLDSLFQKSLILVKIIQKWLRMSCNGCCYCLLSDLGQGEMETQDSTQNLVPWIQHIPAECT